MTDLQDKLSAIIERIPIALTKDDLTAHMRSYLSTDVYDRTLIKEQYCAYMQSSLTKLFTSVLDELQGKSSTHEFTMW